MSSIIETRYRHEYKHELSLVESQKRVREQSDPENHARAKCLKQDPELFFSNDSEEIAKAKQICVGCPVVDWCLREALAANEPGIRGGMSKPERDSFYKRLHH